MNNFERLEKLCKQFDWTYPFADDMRAYRKGELQKKELKNCIEVCEKEDLKTTKEIVLKYQGKYGVCFYKVEE